MTTKDNRGGLRALGKRSWSALSGLLAAAVAVAAVSCGMVDGNDAGTDAEMAASALSPAVEAPTMAPEPIPLKNMPQEKPGTVDPAKEENRLPEEGEDFLDDDADACDLETLPALADGSAAPDPREVPTVNFAVRFQDEVSPYRLMSTSVMPGETITIETVLTDRAAEFTAQADGGTLKKIAKDEWSWKAPKQEGNHCIRITDTTSGETVCLRAFVMVRYNGEEYIGKYRIGQYQRTPLRGDPAYEMPRGFIRVDREDLDLWVSPHFQLRQFLCKQESSFPKYVILRPRLLLKLETLLAQFNERGIKASSFFVMSAYRTPFYNRAIGNTTTYSRHGYGDAADIFIDDDRDGVMDDVTGDGKVTRADAERLYREVEKMTGDPWYRPFIGGMGLYGPKPHRGPFIHVDVRGRRARW